jgi:hypothetical protein
LFPEFEGMAGLSKNMIEALQITRKSKNPHLILFGDKLNHFAIFYKLYGNYFGNKSKG